MTCSIAALWSCHCVELRAQVTGQERAVAAGRELIGQPAPRVRLTTIDGASIDLGELYGKKAVYLKFWATWCVPCRQQMPHFQHTFDTSGTDLAVIAVNAGFNDPLDAVKRYRQELGITMPIVLDDGTLAKRFHLRVTPTHIIIGRDGRIQYVGHLADSSVDAALAAARSGVPALRRNVAADKVPTSDIKAIGIGDLVPPRVLRTVSGHPMPLRKAEDGKITAIVFLSPWCESYLASSRPEVSAECRSVRQQIEALKSRKDIRWLGIASGLWANKDDLLKYQADNHLAMPIALDASGDVFREFRVNDVPTLILADSTAHVVRRLDLSRAGKDDGDSDVNGDVVLRSIESLVARGK